MTPSTTSPSTASRPPENTDRLMVGLCGAIWLVWLVAAVIAAVACVNLGRGGGAARGDSPWLLYTVIAVSAVTILGAIPLLLRARRDALTQRTASDAPRSEVPARRPAQQAVRPATPADAPTEKITIFGTAVDPAGMQPDTRRAEAVSARSAEVDRQWLRGTVSMLGAIGFGWTAVAVATYLLAVGSETGAVVALAAAGIAAVAIPAALVVFSRRLSSALADAMPAS